VTEFENVRERERGRQKKEWDVLKKEGNERLCG
jgi:hypothetical protein